MGRRGNAIRGALPQILATATACFVLAAGATGGGSAAVGGPSWSTIKSPLPVGAITAGLSGVSCTNATNCFAVGSYYDGSFRTLTVRWNGQKWSVVASPNPNGATNSRLSGIACPTAGLCFAVGVSNNQAALERWNGKAWAVVPAPKPSGVRDSLLAGVSCPTATTCFAVGAFRDGSRPQKTLIERWNGKRWTVAAHPKLTGGNRYLFGVSCASATSCSAVGTHSTTGSGDLSCEPELDCSATTLVEQWNGKHWVVVASPNGAYPAFQTKLTGVACPSATSCMAVGTASPEGTWGKMVTERWNGKRWSLVAGANPPGIIGSDLGGVSCSSPTNCYAVGGYRTPHDNATIVDRYNGTSWFIAYRPSVSGTLFSVSCPSATSCVAVGGTTIQMLR